MIRRFAALISLISISCSLLAQAGGSGVFSVLKNPPNALTAAWGGYAPAWRNGDATFMFNNPAVLGESAHNTAALNFNTQLTGVWSGNAAYGLKYKDYGYFGLGVNFINYGSMDAYDAGGNAEGTVSANESVFALGWAYPLNNQFSIGASAKVAYSILAGYVANGMAFDLGGIYTSRDSLFTAGLTFRNAGFMVQHYRDADREPLPFQIDAGVNFKPRHMPFRFNIAAHNLQKPDLTYNQYLQTGNSLDLNGEPVKPSKAPLGDRIVRHISLGTELVLGPQFGVLMGYNHQRRREMGPESGKRVAGFSWGLHLRISKFNITYSSASYFPGFNTNLFTFSARLSDFQKKSPSSP